MTRVARSILPAVLCTALIASGLAPTVYSQARSSKKTPARPSPKQSTPVPQPRPLSVYDEGYQRGYSDGFTQGEADWRQGTPRDFQSSDAYQRREERYDPKYASLEEYIQGYQLGFELGHTDGYYGRPRNAAVPANGAVLAKAVALASARRSREQQSGTETRRRYESEQPRPQRETPAHRNTEPVNIPLGTELYIQLSSSIDTKNNRVGDRFTAIVTSPGPYEGAKIEGHIANINKSGRVSGRTELSLAFDTITLEDGRQGAIAASLERIIESESVKKVDEEGRIESGSRTKDSQVRGGVGAATGAIIGGIIGGVKGAVVGAILGGAAGVGTVYVEGNKDLILDPGTEMVIRTDRPRAR